MSSVARLKEVLSYLPDDWEIDIGDYYPEAFDHSFLGIFQDQQYIGGIDLEPDELNPYPPNVIVVFVHEDRTIEPRGLRNVADCCLCDCSDSDSQKPGSTSTTK
jgi:hypothetical protein